MQFKANLTVLSTLLLIFAIQACQGQLMCYICDDCPKITADTPLLECNENYFNTGGTESSVMTTSEESITSPISEISTSKTETVPTEPTTEQTSSTTEAVEETTVSTEAPIPTPPTAGPVVTIPTVPTPPPQGTVVIPVNDDVINISTTALPIPLVVINATDGKVTTPAAAITTVSPVDSTTTSNSDSKGANISGAVETAAVNSNSTNSNVTDAVEATTSISAQTKFVQKLVRQSRAVANNDVSYHCYKVHKSVNGTDTISRGCSRVTDEEGVCSQLELMNTNVTLSKCAPCPMPRCNGSTTIGVSIFAIIVGVIASILVRN